MVGGQTLDIMNIKIKRYQTTAFPYVSIVLNSSPLKYVITFTYDL